MKNKFYPEYPHAEYNHKDFKKIIVKSILDAVSMFLDTHKIDILYDISNESYYIIHKDRILSRDHSTRTLAIYWLFENGVDRL